MIQDLQIVFFGLFIGLLVVKKDAPFKLSAFVRSSGWTVFNCVLCCSGWTIAALYIMLNADKFATLEQLFVSMFHIGALIGVDWFVLALTGLASWDN